MTELVFTWIILGIALILVAAGWWFIIDRVARAESISVTQALNNLFRPDLDKSKLSYGLVNRVYKLKMRGSAVKGPNKEFLPISAIEVAMPLDDFSFVQNNGGVTDFARQLTDFRHTIAVKKGWVPYDSDPVPVRLTMNSRLRRLRPELRRVHPSQARITRPLSDFTAADATAALNMQGVKVQEAAVRYNGKMWPLSPGNAPYRFGRSSENHITIDWEQVSGRHGEFDFRNGRWVLAGFDEASNETWVNGQKASSPAVLHHGDIITIGGSGPIHFSLIPITEQLPQNF